MHFLYKSLPSYTGKCHFLCALHFLGYLARGPNAEEKLKSQILELILFTLLLFIAVHHENSELRLFVKNYRSYRLSFIMNIPQSIHSAVRLYYGCMGCGAVLSLTLLTVHPRMKELSSSEFALPVLSMLFVFLIIFTGFYVFILEKIKSRKNWARLTLLILFSISIPQWISSNVELLKTTPLMLFFSLASIGIQATQIRSLTLMFNKESNDWFVGRPS
jgi:hypothetical protein